MCFIRKILLYYSIFMIINVKWISCARSTTKKPDINVKIEQLLSDDKSKVSNFLQIAFYRDYPELKSMNATQIHPSHDEYLVKLIDEGYSYAAYADNGTLLGVLLMGPGFVSRYSPLTLKKEIENCKVDYFRRLLAYEEALLDIARALTANPDKSMHIEVAATAPKARRKGVMRRLFQHAMDLCKRKEFKLITCASASQYIGNLCESLEWRCITTLPLLSINDEIAKKPLFTSSHPPHGFARINVIELK